MRRWIVLLIVPVLLVALPEQAHAQTGLYGQRLQSADGQWLLPVASRLLCSDSGMHVRRGSVPSWDICAPNGSAIYAAAPGRVILANCGNQGGYGCWVKLDHGNGLTSAYAHMIRGSIMVQVGQQVDQHTVLGQIGWTGTTSFGPHVHFVIYRNGVHVDPAAVFDQASMQFCDKCAAPGEQPVADAGVAPGRTAQPTIQAVAVSPLYPMVQALAAVDTLSLFWLLAGLLFGLLLLLWFSPNWLRVITVSGLVSAVCGLTVVAMLWPVPVATSSQKATAQAAGDWQLAYRFTAGAEGWKCTRDPVITFGGVTQATYDAWRRSQGLQPTYVCDGSLTEEVRQRIFIDRYWLASGADQLPAAIALTYVDHAFNAGIGAAKRGLTQCGTDAACYNDWRQREYLSMSGCWQYCRGWLNRVARVRTITEK